MNAASLQISAALAAKTSLRDGQYGFCVCHSSERALKGEDCVVFSLLYLVCIALMLRCAGERGLNLVCCQETKDACAKCFHKTKSETNSTTYYGFFFQVLEGHSGFFIHMRSFKFYIKILHS